MSVTAISRRNLLSAGACALAGTAGLLNTRRLLASEGHASGTQGSNMTKEQIIRTYYSGYEKKDWNVSDGVLAASFTFTSPNNDDHISKSVFKERCFLSQLDFIKNFDLEAVFVRGEEAFVKYLCHTTKGTAFRNVDFFRFTDGKIASIETYFGGQAGYPAAAAAK